MKPLATEMYTCVCTHYIMAWYPSPVPEPHPKVPMMSSSGSIHRGYGQVIISTLYHMAHVQTLRLQHLYSLGRKQPFSAPYTHGHVKFWGGFGLPANFCLTHRKPGVHLWARFHPLCWTKRRVVWRNCVLPIILHCSVQCMGIMGQHNNK
jgi:hypothetical protein